MAHLPPSPSIRPPHYTQARQDDILIDPPLASTSAAAILSVQHPLRHTHMSSARRPPDGNSIFEPLRHDKTTAGPSVARGSGLDPGPSTFPSFLSPCARFCGATPGVY